MKKLAQLLTVFLVALLIGLAVGATLPEAVAAPLLGRTSVDGVWGFAPNTQTITGSQTLTPTLSEYHFNNGAVLTLTLASGNALPGDRLRLVSLVTTNTIVLTNNTGLSANETISQNDVLEFEFFNSQWNKVVDANN